MARALDHAARYRDSVPDRHILGQLGLAEARARFLTPLPDQGQPAAQVIDRMVADGDAGLVQFASPRFFGFVTGGSDPTGVAADILVSAWGQNTANTGQTATVGTMERAVCDWVISLLGLPDEAGAGIVTGGTVANTTAVMVARNALLRAHGWDADAQGLFGAPEIQVIVGDEAHSSVFGALRYAGLGAERVHRAPVDGNGTIDAEGFARLIAGLQGPILVILQAGHINSGGFDPFATIIPVAHDHDAWVHVDGAFGLWLAAVPELADRLAGVDQADSWGVDLHKWLNAPYDAGMVIVRKRADLVQAMSAKASYLPGFSETWDPSDSVMELSRRARGVPSYAILRSLGRDGVREMVRRHCRLACYGAEKLARIDGVQVMNDITANQVAIRVGKGASGDEATRAVLAKVQENGRVFPSHGVWKGRQIIRVSISNHKTQAGDIDLLVAEIADAWQSVRGGNNA